MTAVLMTATRLAAILCGAVAASARPAIVFGPEDPRRTVSSADYPFNSVGRLQKRSGAFCTATLISDRHILTAGHCFVAERDAELRATRLVDLAEFTFLPNYRDDGTDMRAERGLMAIVAHGAFDLHPRYGDWAIAELDAAVDPRRYGSMGMASDDELFALEDPGAPLGAGSLRHIGYTPLHPNQGASPISVGGCSQRQYISQVVVDAVDRNRRAQWWDRITMFAHDCSASAGQSGGPIFLMRGGRAFMVGIHTLEDLPKELAPTRNSEAIRQSAFDFVHMNYAVSVVQFGPAARALVETAVRPESWGRVKRTRPE